MKNSVDARVHAFIVAGLIIPAASVATTARDAAMTKAKASAADAALSDQLREQHAAAAAAAAAVGGKMPKATQAGHLKSDNVTLGMDNFDYFFGVTLGDLGLDAPAADVSVAATGLGGGGGGYGGNRHHMIHRHDETGDY